VEQTGSEPKEHRRRHVSRRRVGRWPLATDAQPAYRAAQARTDWTGSLAVVGRSARDLFESAAKHRREARTTRCFGLLHCTPGFSRRLVRDGRDGESDRWSSEVQGVVAERHVCRSLICQSGTAENAVSSMFCFERPDRLPRSYPYVVFAMLISWTAFRADARRSNRGRIGASGATGWASLPHLASSVRRNAAIVLMIGPPIEPPYCGARSLRVRGRGSRLPVSLRPNRLSPRSYRTRLPDKALCPTWSRRSRAAVNWPPLHV